MDRGAYPPIYSPKMSIEYPHQTQARIIEAIKAGFTQDEAIKRVGTTLGFLTMAAGYELSLPLTM